MSFFSSYTSDQNLSSWIIHRYVTNYHSAIFAPTAVLSWNNVKKMQDWYFGAPLSRWLFLSTTQQCSTKEWFFCGWVPWTIIGNRDLRKCTTYSRSVRIFKNIMSEYSSRRAKCKLSSKRKDIQDNGVLNWAELMLSETLNFHSAQFNI